MASASYNLEQRKIGLKKYIDIFGIELLNKIAQNKKGVDILEMTTTDLGNLKKTLDLKGFKHKQLSLNDFKTTYIIPYRNVLAYNAIS